MLNEFLTNDSILVILNDNKDKIIEDIRSKVVDFLKDTTKKIEKSGKDNKKK